MFLVLGEVVYAARYRSCYLYFSAVLRWLFLSSSLIVHAAPASIAPAVPAS